MSLKKISNSPLLRIPLIIVSMVVLFSLYKGVTMPKFNKGNDNQAVVSIKPIQPSDDVPTWEEVQNERRFNNQSLEDGTLQEDPEIRDQREEIIQMAEELQSDICNEDLRDEYAQKVSLFLSRYHLIWGKPYKGQKVFKSEWETASLTKQLNRPVMREIGWSIEEGLLYRSDLVKKQRIMVPKHLTKVQKKRKRDCENQ